MKKFFSILAALAVLNFFTSSVLAAGNSAPKTTGNVGYTAAGLQRYAEFEAIQTNHPSWMVNGTNTISIPWAGTNYLYPLTLSQNGTSLTGTLSDPYYPTTGTITGNIAGNVVTLAFQYPAGSIQGLRTFVGTINPLGNIVSGTWTETGSEAASGSWSTVLNFATISTSGKGSFNYSDANGSWYKAEVQYFSSNGTDAYFTGPVTAASDPSWIGNWVQVADHDGGEPAYLVDHIWGIFTDANTAKYNVLNQIKPDGDFVITSGNLQVK